MDRHSGVDNEIVPFGKYRGQPVAALAGDRAYLDWLMGQAWFREKFSTLHTIVINNFQEPNETPEHNAMQVEFLNDAYLVKVIGAYIDLIESEWRFRVTNRQVRFETKGVDALISFTSSMIEGLIIYRDDSRCEFGVELKPRISDDYPAVLRQVIAQRGTRLVIVGKYDGVGATWEQVVKTFMLSGIGLIRESSLHIIEDDRLDNVRLEIEEAADIFVRDHSSEEVQCIDRVTLVRLQDQCSQTGKRLRRGRDYGLALEGVAALRRGLAIVSGLVHSSREEKAKSDAKWAKMHLGLSS